MPSMKKKLRKDGSMYYLISVSRGYGKSGKVKTRKEKQEEERQAEQRRALEAKNRLTFYRFCEEISQNTCAA